MNIQQAAKQTGLVSANIRYYEKEGLLRPGRNPGNGYREYQDTDLERLKQIRALRSLGIPVPQIRRVFDGEESLSAVLQERLPQLRQEQKKLAKMEEACTILLEQKTELEALDADLLSFKLEFDQKKEELLMKGEWNRKLEKIERTAILVNKCGICWVCLWQLTKLLPQYEYVWENPWIVLPPVIVILANVVVLSLVRNLKQ